MYKISREREKNLLPFTVKTLLCLKWLKERLKNILRLLFFEILAFRGRIFERRQTNPRLKQSLKTTWKMAVQTTQKGMALELLMKQAATREWFDRMWAPRTFTCVPNIFVQRLSTSDIYNLTTKWSQLNIGWSSTFCFYSLETSNGWWLNKKNKIHGFTFFEISTAVFALNRTWYYN